MPIRSSRNLAKAEWRCIGRDTKLDRNVALKILPDLFAGDPERRMRFEREAKTLASLNHPHIAQIHGFEQQGPTSALVMELADGEDLSRRIRSQKQSGQRRFCNGWFRALSSRRPFRQSNAGLWRPWTT
ncbi:MAG: protein kinase [Vicinamibacterales bacterium]